jgi:hypothetical protein
MRTISGVDGMLVRRPERASREKMWIQHYGTMIETRRQKTFVPPRMQVNSVQDTGEVWTVPANLDSLISFLVP